MACECRFHVVCSHVSVSVSVHSVCVSLCVCVCHSVCVCRGGRVGSNYKVLLLTNERWGGGGGGKSIFMRTAVGSNLL